MIQVSARHQYRHLRDQAAAYHYGSIRAALEQAGQPIGVNDLHIAAHARSQGLTLVTNNLREFERVPGLMLENWV
jgi:tRNA(fMet)-specific endonuclease VapC